MKRTLVFLVFLTTGLAVVAVGLWLRLWSADLSVSAAEAYQRGDYATAATLYQQASKAGCDAGLAAYNQAAALYRLGRFHDADRRYDSAARKSAELRAARAAYDRGNCALQQAVRKDGTPDAELLVRAAEQYRCCLEHETRVKDAGSLFHDARHNLELAQLLGAPPSAAGESGNRAEQPSGQPEEQDAQAGNEQNSNEAKKDGSQDNKAGAQDAKQGEQANKGQKADPPKPKEQCPT
jgi:hypothetical protein